MNINEATSTDLKVINELQKLINTLFLTFLIL